MKAEREHVVKSPSTRDHGQTVSLVMIAAEVQVNVMLEAGLLPIPRSSPRVT